MNKRIYLKKRFAKNPSIVARKIAGEYILVPTRQNVQDLNSIYTLTEVGSFIWEALDGKRKVCDIKKLIRDKFAVTPIQVENDLIGFLRQLEKAKAIISR